ncbi:MAG: SUMF1/EgtB/PvdO family nonheme iron enzyme, partial [Nitrospina sp.]|nr:SUMF1/EgtB/PvdO family nonheme iron enzyme [Nitrospina sp.]
YGEPGWNEVTDENLWPFPNERIIRELMRETVDGVSGIYGFCVDGQSLTNYIWAYLGNTAPPFNVRAIPGNKMITLKWDTPAEIAIDSITAFNVYKLVGQTKTLVGGTITGNTNCSKTISGLKNGSTYEFAITAIDKQKGESGLSYTVRVAPKKSEKLSGGKSSPDGTIQKERIAGTAKAMVGKEFSNKLGMEFSLIQPGTFTMGSLSDEQEVTPHQVTLTKGFYIQKTEVTQGQWKKIMGMNPSFFKECGDHCPVEQVSWNEVQQFIKQLNQLEGTIKYRLPTEAEWEYACRAGTKTFFSFGECLTSQEANYNGEHPFRQCKQGVFRKMPISAKASLENPWGLIGMHGNVWEWCQDWLDDYASIAVVDPLGPPSGSLRVIRGGAWNSYAKACRSGNRSGIEPTKRFANLGFRLVRDQ